jgi:hypothetical protein
MPQPPSDPLDGMVTLDWDEVFYGAQVGAQWRIEALKRNLRHVEGREEDLGEDEVWFYSINSACAEQAGAKYFNVFWPPKVGKLDHEDLWHPAVGWIGVRSTHHLKGKLRVLADDPDDRVYVLVTGVAPRFWVRGWAFGYEAKRPEWLMYRAGGSGYFMPQKDMRSVSDLWAWMNGR